MNKNKELIEIIKAVLKAREDYVRFKIKNRLKSK
jgi:hypothetical protein